MPRIAYISNDLSVDLDRIIMIQVLKTYQSLIEPYVMRIHLNMGNSVEEIDICFNTEEHACTALKGVTKLCTQHNLSN